MATKNGAQSTKVVTGEVRLSYTHLFEPYSSEPGQPEKYSCMILIPKSDKKTLEKIKGAIEAAKEQGKDTKWGGKIPPRVHLTLHDGDGETDDGTSIAEEYPERAGHYFMSISAKTQPGIVDRQLNPILDSTEVYSGCYARVSMNAFPYTYGKKSGISFGLNHVQKLRDGEMFGGRSRAEDDFEALEDDIDEDSTDDLADLI